MTDNLDLGQAAVHQLQGVERLQAAHAAEVAERRRQVPLKPLPAARMPGAGGPGQELNHLLHEDPAKQDGRLSGQNLPST